MSLSPVIQKSSVHSRSYFGQGAASPFLPAFPKSLCLSIAALRSDELSHQVSVILMTPKSSDCMCTSTLSSLLPMQHILVHTSTGLPVMLLSEGEGEKHSLPRPMCSSLGLQVLACIPDKLSLELFSLGQQTCCPVQPGRSHVSPAALIP